LTFFSKYVPGGFDGTSNVLAGKLFNIPVKGTHAHAYITSFNGFTDLRNKILEPKTGGEPRDLLELALSWRTKLIPIFKVMASEASDGELAALISFAIAFPDGFMALVDTYDVKRYSCRMTHATSVWSVTLPNTQSHNEYR
jgi:nicotinate phosphoribosyltransferase